MSVVTLTLKIKREVTGVIMNNYTKLTLAIMLLSSASSFAREQNSEQTKNIPHQRPSFESIDANTNGEIDFDEFSSKELPHGDHQTIFDMIDADSNGFISNNEFVNHKPPQPKKHKGAQS